MCSTHGTRYNDECAECISWDIDNPPAPSPRKPAKLLCRDWVGRKATTKRVIRSRGGSAIPEGVVVEIAHTYRGRFTVRFGAIEIMQVEANALSLNAPTETDHAR